jgi:SAM-dependent methyltransferase
MASCCTAFIPLLSVKQKPTKHWKHLGSLYSLVPEENPDFDPAATSISGVLYRAVLAGLDRLFPPKALDQRNALSRSDGYWPYISKGEDPPQHLTYGEFDFYFFAQLLDQARSFYDTSSLGWDDKVFVDIGSGTGRLVLSAAALHPTWRVCRGIELLPSIHQAAQENLENCLSQDEESPSLLTQDENGQESRLPIAPVDFICGSFEDPYVYFGDADCIFCFSSCMTAHLLDALALSIGRQCKPGTIVITTEYMLSLKGQVPPTKGDDRVPHGSFELELVKQVDGYCWLTGGASTAYIHRVKVSSWTPEYQPLNPPKQSAEDMAFEVAKALEDGKLGDAAAFKRGVYNQMIFLGLPESWLPNLADD